jgi:hypothetical protein
LMWAGTASTYCARVQVQRAYLPSYSTQGPVPFRTCGPPYNAQFRESEPAHTTGRMMRGTMHATIRNLRDKRAAALVVRVTQAINDAQRVPATILCRTVGDGTRAHPLRQVRKAGRAVIRYSEAKSHVQQLTSSITGSPIERRCSAVANISPLAAERNGSAASEREPLRSVTSPVEHPNRGVLTSPVRHQMQPSRPRMWRCSWLTQSSPVVA